MEDAHQKVMEKKRIMLEKMNQKYQYKPTLYQNSIERETKIHSKHLNPMKIKPKSPVEKLS